MTTKQYRCNNSFYRPPYHYNMGAVISEETYNSIPKDYQKWFTDTAKPPHFYCQNLCGDVDFSIDEWNELYKVVSGMGLSVDEERFMLFGPQEGCNEQCFTCMAIVGKQRIDLQKRIAARNNKLTTT